MSDEIKEILDNVKKCCDITKDRSFTVYQRQDILKLLDCITNLQEENMKLISENETIKNIKYTVDETIYKSRNEKAVEIYENRNTCKYKKERFMEDKSTSDLMYEALTGGDDNGTMDKKSR